MKKIMKTILLLMVLIAFTNQSNAQFVPALKTTNYNFETHAPIFKYTKLSKWKTNLFGTASVIIQDRIRNASSYQIGFQNKFPSNQHFNFRNKQYLVERPYSIMKITY